MKDWLIRLYRAYAAGRVAAAKERARIYGYQAPPRPAANAAPANDRAANDAGSTRKRDAA